MPILLLFPHLLLMSYLLVECFKVERRHLLHLLALLHQVVALFVKGVLGGLHHHPLVVVEILSLTLPYLVSLLAKLVTFAVHILHLPPHGLLLLPVLRDLHLINLGGLLQNGSIFAYFRFVVISLALQLHLKHVTHVSLVTPLLFEVLLLLELMDAVVVHRDFVPVIRLPRLDDS